MDTDTTAKPARRIVVGYDGSPISRMALEDAARRAGPDGELFVVHAFHEPGAQYGHPNADEKLLKEREHAREVLAGVDALVTGAQPGVRWESELLSGPAAEAIVRVAEVRDADEIHVGSRGVGRARGLLGSVAHDVLRLADRPVVVIPERAALRAAETR